MDIKNILDSLSLEDLVGQVLCYDIYDKDDPKEVEEVIKKIRPGGLFFSSMSTEKIKLIIDKIAAAGIERVRFTGGEPLMRKDIFELAEYAKSKGLVTLWCDVEFVG